MGGRKTNPFEKSWLAEGLANTYTSEIDGFERLTQYRQVLNYAAEHPSMGSAAIATALDLPRGRIRPWLEDESKPEPVKAVEFAEQNDWLDLDCNSSLFQALNILVAWTFAGGGIDRQFVPHFTVDSERQEVYLKQIVSEVGVESRDRHADETSRAKEIVPKNNGTILGRFLTVLGAPQGVKNQRGELSLPGYLSDCPDTVAKDFARIYVSLRGTPSKNRDSWPLQFSESRSAGYTRELKRLLKHALGNTGSVIGDPQATTLYLSTEAAKELDQLPTLHSS